MKIVIKLMEKPVENQFVHFTFWTSGEKCHDDNIFGGRQIRGEARTELKMLLFYFHVLFIFCFMLGS